MSDPDPEHLVGELAFVTTRIRGREQPGEVQIKYGGRSESFIAYGDEAIERGQQVLVIARRPGRAVDVIYFAG
jgi:membrane protein implicated in regulation of membrane protease activity